MRTHHTTWEDGGFAGFYCFDDVTGVAGEMQTIGTEESKKCNDCYQNLRLIWDVRIQEDEPTETQPQSYWG